MVGQDLLKVELVDQTRTKIDFFYSFLHTSEHSEKLLSKYEVVYTKGDELHIDADSMF